MKILYGALLGILAIYNVKAQIVNFGEMTVLKNTELSIHSDLINGDKGEILNDGNLYVHENMKNNGLFTFVEAQDSNVHLIGNKTQSISGNMPIELYNLHLNNNSSPIAFTLSADLIINGTLNFGIGIIDNKNHIGYIGFQENATALNISNDSHILGTVEKYGENSFAYPIGNGSYYRGMGIEHEEGFTKSLKGAYVSENSHDQYPHNNLGNSDIYYIDDKEYWTVKSDKYPFEIVLTLSWNVNTTSNKILREVVTEKLRIIRWDEIRSVWVDEGGVVDITKKTISAPMEITGDAVFALALAHESNKASHIEVFNAVSPNGDGKNDYFIIQNINKYPNNRVQIYNRWGTKVFETTNYDSNGNRFTGISDPPTTINRWSKVQTGTYYYLIEYEITVNGTPKKITKTGFLYVNNG